MDWFTIVKRYYDWGNYDNEDVRVFLNSGKITPEQYKVITGEDPYAE
jgi:uncharacterized XkdX family phage protein